MARIQSHEKIVIEKLLQMESGNVLDFTNNTMRDFFIEEFAIDIYDEKYDFEYTSKSKANRLRGIWRAEKPKTVGEIISTLILRLETRELIDNQEISEGLKKLMDIGHNIAIKIYSSNNSTIENKLGGLKNSEKTRRLEKQEKIYIHMRKDGLNYFVSVNENEEIELSNNKTWEGFYKIIFNHPKELELKEVGEYFVSNFNKTGKDANSLMKEIFRITGKYRKILKTKKHKTFFREGVEIVK